MEDQEASRFKAGFIRRVIEARLASGYTQEDIAELLDTSQGTYQKYEGRSMMPHRLIPKFCRLTRVEIAWLFGAAEAAQRHRRASKKRQPVREEVRRVAT